MKFTQYYLDCLSQASYLIGDETTGRAVVVDPRRDIDEYVSDAAAAGLTIELVVETHFHADFLSGHLELAAATGAAIGYSSVASPDFDHRSLDHGERLVLGEVELEFRHTPGHTPESMSIVVWERGGDAVPYGVLTGDTLFIGDVGRPDLLASVGVSGDDLAAQLYDSLHSQLMTLPDATRVFPAHGAGSACGKNLSTETSSTIGEQRSTNYALHATDRDQFVELVTAGQAPPPAYFSFAARANRQVREVLDESAPVPEWQPQTDGNRHPVVVDGRSPEEFARGHLRGSINVGTGGRFAEYVGSVTDPDDEIVLLVESGEEVEARNRLARIGFDGVIGHVPEPDRWLVDHPDDVAVASRLSVDQLRRVHAEQGDLQLVDVRNPGEVALGSIDGAIAIAVGQLPGRITELDPTRPTVVFCAGGYRSSLAASVLRRAGFADVSDLLGGYGAWVAAAT